MRRALEKIEGKRTTFTAVFERFGTKRGWKGYLEDTILVKEVVELETNIIVAGHLWFTVGKRLANIQFQEGDKIRFDARVTSYIKGYRGYGFKDLEVDYRLSNPTNIKKVRDAKE